MHKDAKIGIATTVLIGSILGVSLAYSQSVKNYETTVEEAKNYVLTVPASTSSASIQKWLKQKNITFFVVPNDEKDGMNSVVISEVGLDTKKVGSYIGSWANKPIVNNGKDYNFGFYFDKKDGLLKAKTEERIHRNMDF